MKILYLSLSYLPSRRGNSVQVMKMCQALAQLGHDVTLVGKDNPRISEPQVDGLHAFYGVEPNFQILRFPRPGGSGGGIIYALHVWRVLRRRRAQTDLVYARDPVGAYLATKLGLRTIYEVHEFPAGARRRSVHRLLLRQRCLCRVVTNSRVLRDDFLASGLIRHADVVVAYNGAEGPDGDMLPPVREMGRRPQLGFVGNLYPGKGMEIIAGLAARMPDCDVHVIGGEERDLAVWRASGLADNVVLHGFVRPADLNTYYGRCDVMLLPVQREVYGVTRTTNFSRWTTPLKMFEYMAEGRPIVASDLPVIREVLDDDRNALLVPPNDLDAWEAAVRRLIDDASLRRRLAGTAFEEFRRNYTRQARARRVLEALKCPP